MAEGSGMKRKQQNIDLRNKVSVGWVMENKESSCRHYHFEADDPHFLTGALHSLIPEILFIIFYIK